MMKIDAMATTQIARTTRLRSSSQARRRESKEDMFILRQDTRREKASERSGMSATATAMRIMMAT